MKLAALILAVACSGCSWSGVSRSREGAWRAWNLRFAWATEGFEVTHGTNVTSVRLQRSNGDAALAEGVARGVAEGLK